MVAIPPVGGTGVDLSRASIPVHPSLEAPKESTLDAKSPGAAALRLIQTVLASAAAVPKQQDLDVRT